MTPPTRRSLLKIVLPVALGLLLLGGAVARGFYVETHKVAHTGMAPTLSLGDRIFVRKDAYGKGRGPARGDIIVFRDPEHPDRDSIDRVIGLPGDTITVQDGAAFINGWRIPTCVAGLADVDSGEGPRAGFAVLELIGDATYLVFRDPPKHSHGEEAEEHPPRGQNEGPFTVPNNEVFVLGDNREHSDDSRYWSEGRGKGVPVDQIRGRATTVWMSQKTRRLALSKPGSNLTAAPQCPEGFLAATCEAIGRCLSIRPPPEQMSPPAPSQSAAPTEPR